MTIHPYQADMVELELAGVLLKSLNERVVGKNRTYFTPMDMDVPVLS